MFSEPTYYATGFVTHRLTYFVSKDVANGWYRRWLRISRRQEVM